MATKEFYIGTSGPYLIEDDDALYTHPRQLAVKEDVTNGIVNASNSVEDETSFGLTPDAGVSNDFSRSDHRHGTPTNPVSGLSGTYNFSTIVVGDVISMTFTNGLLTAVTTL